LTTLIVADLQTFEPSHNQRQGDDPVAWIFRNDILWGSFIDCGRRKTHNDHRGDRFVPAQEPELGLQALAGIGRKEARRFSVFPGKGGPL